MFYQSLIKDYQIVVKPARKSIIDGNVIEIAAHRIQFKDYRYKPQNTEHMTKEQEEAYLDGRYSKQRRMRFWKITDAEMKLAKQKARDMEVLNARYKSMQDDVDKTKPKSYKDKRFSKGVPSTATKKEGGDNIMMDEKDNVEEPEESQEEPQEPEIEEEPSNEEPEEPQEEPSNEEPEEEKAGEEVKAEEEGMSEAQDSTEQSPVEGEPPKAEEAEGSDSAKEGDPK